MADRKINTKINSPIPGHTIAYVIAGRDDDDAMYVLKSDSSGNLSVTEAKRQMYDPVALAWVNVTDLSLYQSADIDDGGATRYYGFLDPVGNWYIMQATSTATRWCKGTGLSAYQTAWTARGSQTYDYYSTIF